MGGSDDSSPADAPAKKRSHHKKKADPVDAGLAELVSANLDVSSLRQSTSGFFQFAGSLVAMPTDPESGIPKNAVKAAVIGQPKITIDPETGFPTNVDARRADHNADVLVRAAEKNKYLMRLLITIHKAMSGGELGKLVGDVALAAAVDANMMSLDNQFVTMFIGQDIPPEVWAWAQRKAAQPQPEPSASAAA